MKLKLLGALTTAAMIAATGAHAAAYWGQGAQSAASYQMYIITDGTVGALTKANITDWDITVTDANGSLEMTKANSGLNFYHDIFTTGGVDDFDNGHLIATADALSFDFSGAAADGSGLFWVGTDDHIHGHSAVLCIQGMGCIDNTSGPGYGLAGNGYDYELIPVSGNVVIGVAVPEPQTWAMMIMGVLGLGAVLRQRRARSAAIA